MNDLRDKIARALAEWQDGPNAEPWVHDMYTEAADAVLAVLDLGEIRAEALRDVARVLTDALPESPSAAQTDRMKFAIGFLHASAASPYRKADR